MRRWRVVPTGAYRALKRSLPSGCRGLRFIQVFLQSICDGERDENHPSLVRVNATKAYEMALKKYHGWIVQKIFQVSRAAGPEGPPARGARPLPRALWLRAPPPPTPAQEGLPRPSGVRLVLRGTPAAWWAFS